MGKKQQASKNSYKAQQQRGSKKAEEGSGEGSAPERRKASKQQRRKNKEHHYAADDLEQELLPLGLRIKTIEADGNCFFRSVCDQLEGEGGDHMALRCRVMSFIEEREEEYRFFIEDDEPFDKYMKRMKKDGAWAGHLELQAASLLLEHNISVYQAGQPVWHIRNFGEDAPTLHLSYHDGMHYNSVRKKDDYGSGPPEPLRVASSADLAAAGADVAGRGTAGAAEAAARPFGVHEVDQVVAGTGCMDRQRIFRLLEQCGGSTDQAIEVLIEQLAQEGEEDGQQVQGEAAALGGQALEATTAAAAITAEQQHGQAGSGEQQEQGVRASSSSEALQQAGSSSQPRGGGSEAPGAEADSTQGHEVQQQQQQQVAQQGSASITLQLTPDPEDSSCIRAVLELHSQQGQQTAQWSAEDRAALARTAGEAAAAGAAASAADDAAGHARSKKERASKKGVKVKHPKAAAHIGRNTRCPCGSTRKYKNCCGVGRGARAMVGGTVPAAADCDSGGAKAAVAAAAQQLQVLYI